MANLHMPNIKHRVGIHHIIKTASILCLSLSIIVFFQYKCTVSKTQKLNRKIMQIELFSISLLSFCVLRVEMKEVNRLKIILAEKNKTGKWLAEQLGKDPSTVSKWCSNSSQPQLDTVVRIAELLEVDIEQLINR